MFLKRYLLYSIFITTIMSCAPSFDLEKENKNLITSLQKLSNPEKRVDVFYPASYNTDSIKALILEENKGLLHAINKMGKHSDVQINTVSSAISIQERLFRIVNANSTYKLNLNQYMLSEEELKKSLDNNHIDYVEKDKTLTIKANADYVTIFHDNRWEYFDFNVSILYDAYGLKDTKRLVQLYYNEVFEPAKEKWDAESIADFKNIYNENKDLPQYQKLNYDAYCDCLILHYEKFDDDKTYTEDFFMSETYQNKMYSCRILTTQE